MTQVNAATNLETKTSSGQAVALRGPKDKNACKLATAPAEYSEKWLVVQTKLRAQIGEDHYESWFTGLNLEGFVDGTALLTVSTSFLRNWIQSHHADLLLDLMQEQFDDVESLSLEVRGSVRKTLKKKIANPSKENDSTEDSGNDPAFLRHAPGGDGPNGGVPLDLRYSFASFCVGQGNSLAYRAMKAIAVGDRSVNLSTIFIHAKVGLGKTHLLQAVAIENARNPKGRRVLYLTSERFMQKLRDGIVNKTIAELKERMRDVDVLLIDDIQFLNGDKFLREFGHLVNDLIDSGKQIVVTADRPAMDLTNIDDRVSSRFRGGIAFELVEPDRELRRKIVQTRLAALRAVDPSITLPDSVIEYIVQAITTNGRDLEGALNRLTAQQKLTLSPVTMESAQLVLKDLIQNDEPRKVLIEDIQRTVAAHFNISKGDLVSQRRTRVIVRPRQIAMYLSKSMTPRSLPEIGKRFGGRDHTTVIHAVQKVEELMKEDRAFRDDVELLRQLLNDLG